MLKRTTLFALLLVCLAGLTGCFHQQVIVDPAYDASKTVPDFTRTHVHVLGLINLDNQINLDEVCPSGAGMVENKTLFRSDAVFIPGIGFILGFPIGPIVAIEEFAVYCK
jgi:hypothetical protein